jgi:hypothetical protein
MRAPLSLLPDHNPDQTAIKTAARRIALPYFVSSRDLRLMTPSGISPFDPFDPLHPYLHC